jgi:hypothetical protein
MFGSIGWIKALSGRQKKMAKRDHLAVIPLLIDSHTAGEF